MNELITSASLISLFTLTLLEIVLGIDNVIFVSIIMGRMPNEYHKRARFLWMIFGIIVRVILLASLGWLVAHGEKPLFTLPIVDKTINLKSIIMLAGGLFLLVKTIGEIHTKLEGDEDAHNGTVSNTKAKSFASLMAQIVLVDMVFSFDSIITAIGIADKIIIMGTAVTIAMMIMFLFSGRIAAFIDKHPTIKMLALSFLVMVGLVLIMEGWAPEKAEALHIKNYLYFGMAFSLIVEMLNIKTRAKGKRAPIQFHEKDIDDSMKKDMV
jgi:predicted tellurium resistance membrane protein TerC